jgi:hypothetical protein
MSGRTYGIDRLTSGLVSRMTEIERLQKTIRDQHGCGSTHRESVTVHETFPGKVVWDGVVEVFSLTDHPRAKRAFAWSYKSDTGEKRYVAVLSVPPIITPLDAVGAYASKKQKK